MHNFRKFLLALLALTTHAPQAAEIPARELPTVNGFAIVDSEGEQYIGVNYEGLLGDTRDLADDNDEETSDTQPVAGLRFWF